MGLATYNKFSAFSFLRHFFLFLILVVLIKSSVYAISCSSLGDSAQLIVTEKLCDSLVSKHSAEFVRVLINFKTSLDEPISPADKNSPSEAQYFYDSVYAPWLQTNISILNRKADTLCNTFDLRHLNDTAMRITSENSRDKMTFEKTGVITCQLRVANITDLSKLPYITKIEVFEDTYPLHSYGIKMHSKSFSKGSNNEYFTFSGRKFVSVPFQYRQYLTGIIISRAVSPSGNIVTQKVLHKK
ncbi:MAG: hypothetical protein JW915_07480 [Chitinispirillaceae bacterium]|nr:hypothetical protein [Chitinispirillaceae bacterium]